MSGYLIIHTPCDRPIGHADTPEEAQTMIDEEELGPICTICTESTEGRLKIRPCPAPTAIDHALAIEPPQVMPSPPLTRRVLFVNHTGFYCGDIAGIIIDDHALPVAVAPKDDEDGFSALWESVSRVEDFFDAIQIDHTEGSGGLWVYEVEMEACENELGEEWDHLQGGELRRLTRDELLRLEQGAPWIDGEML